MINKDLEEIGENLQQLQQLYDQNRESLEFLISKENENETESDFSVKDLVEGGQEYIDIYKASGYKTWPEQWTQLQSQIQKLIENKLEVLNDKANLLAERIKQIGDRHDIEGAFEEVAEYVDEKQFWIGMLEDAKLGVALNEPSNVNFDDPADQSLLEKIADFNTTIYVIKQRKESSQHILEIHTSRINELVHGQ